MQSESFDQDGHATSHLVFAWTPAGYRLEERTGQPPSVGTQIEFGERVEWVTKVAPSPIPGDSRLCAYLMG